MKLTTTFLFALVVAVHPTAAQVEESWGCGAKDLKCQLTATMKALEANPRLPENYFNVAIVQQRAGMHKEAAEAFGMVIAIPNAKRKLIADSHNGRGFSLRSLKKAELALADFDKAISLDGNTAIYHYNRGYALLDLGRQADALGAYDRAIAIDPKFGFAYYARATILMAQKKFDPAIADATRVLQLLPNYESAYMVRGSSFFGKEAYAKAILDFDRFIAWPRASPKHLSETIFLRGLSHLNIGTYQKSVDDFSRYIAEFPGNKEAFQMRALAYRKLNKIALAEADEKKAAELK